MFSDPTYPLVSVMNLLASILVLIPLPWFIAHWNAGACAYALWISLDCLRTGVNTIIWADNTNPTIPVWCDISK